MRWMPAAAVAALTFLGAAAVAIPLAARPPSPVLGPAVRFTPRPAGTSAAPTGTPSTGTGHDPGRHDANGESSGAVQTVAPAPPRPVESEPATDHHRD